MVHLHSQEKAQMWKSTNSQKSGISVFCIKFEKCILKEKLMIMFIFKILHLS